MCEVEQETTPFLTVRYAANDITAAAAAVQTSASAKYFYISLALKVAAF